MLDPKVKKLLNDFSLTQIALQDSGKGYPESAIKLGDIIDAILATQADHESRITALEP